MKEHLYIACLLGFLSSINPLIAADHASEELKVVPELDLQRYSGLWYEIARLPNRFQKGCARDVTATYVLLEDGTVSVTNSCLERDGGLKKAQGVARKADAAEPSSKLKVRFAPSILSFLPFVWGDYWVIELAPDYSYSVVGVPSRDYLWILARTPRIEASLYNQILAAVARQGYDPGRLIETPQSEKP